MKIIWKYFAIREIPDQIIIVIELQFHEDYENKFVEIYKVLLATSHVQSGSWW